MLVININNYCDEIMNSGLKKGNSSKLQLYQVKLKNLKVQLPFP